MDKVLNGFELSAFVLLAFVVSFMVKMPRCSSELKIKLKVISCVLQAKDMCISRYADIDIYIEIYIYMDFVYLYMYIYLSVHTYIYIFLVHIHNIFICLHVMRVIHATAYTGSMQKVTI